MKTVLGNAMCAHMWAHLSQAYGRSDSMSFSGSVAYSYREPVAHIVRTARGNVCLTTSRYWSPTTGRHVSLYASAAGHLQNFRVPDLLLGTSNARPSGEAGHAVNLAHLVAKYQKRVTELMRAQCTSQYMRAVPSSYPYASLAHEALHDLADTVTRYNDYFGTTAIEPNWREDAAAVIARRDRLLADPTRQAKIAAAGKARAERDAAAVARLFAANLELVAAWRAGGSAGYNNLSCAKGGALLRIVGDEVQTSWGAVCPLDDARRALAYWKVSPRPAGPLHIRLGSFHMEGIDEAGTVNASCHKFYADELENLCKLIAAVPA